MRKIIFATLSVLTVAFSFMVLSGCGSSKTSATANKTADDSSMLSNDEISSIIAGLSPDEEIIIEESNATQETQKEVKTKTETAEELVAKVLQAFCDKDAETFDALAASCTGSSLYIQYYSTVYNDWCKAADEAGLDWKNLTTTPEEWKIYRLDYTAVDDIRIEMYYPSLSDNFTFYIGIDQFDYNTETYSMHSIYSIPKGITAEKLQKIDKYVNTGEKVPVSGVAVAVYSVDIEKYLN